VLARGVPGDEFTDPANSLPDADGGVGFRLLRFHGLNLIRIMRR